MSSSSQNSIEDVEKQILAYLQAEHSGYYVDIGKVVGKTTSDLIWTVSLNEHYKTIPVVMLHGMGAGSALWVLNLDDIAVNNTVYSIDLLGFGRSSRPTFATSSASVEKQMVQAIEAWREVMHLSEMILVGHSLGGFLATSYAITHPQRVKHLVLAEPWGFSEKPNDSEILMPMWIRIVGRIVRPLNPLWAIRLSGRFGPWLVQKVRPDITRKYAPLLGENTAIIGLYICLCNSQKPSGESAFHHMMTGRFWAKRPLLPRLGELNSTVPMSIIYGSRSWMDHATAEQIREQRQSGSTVDVKIINGASHYVFADQIDIFNECLAEILVSY